MQVFSKLPCALHRWLVFASPLFFLRLLEWTYLLKWITMKESRVVCKICKRDLERTESEFNEVYEYAQSLWIFYRRWGNSTQREITGYNRVAQTNFYANQVSKNKVFRSCERLTSHNSWYNGKTSLIFLFEAPIRAIVQYVKKRTLVSFKGHLRWNNLWKIIKNKFKIKLYKLNTHGGYPYNFRILLKWCWTRS